MITPFKNRKFDQTKPVYIYRNLHRKGKVYSIMQNTVVVGHCENLNLTEATFIINKAGKKKAIETKIRNVHAFIKGFICNAENIDEQDFVKLYYHPFEQFGFHIGDYKDINSARFVNISENGVKVKI